jgi:hypothetical protein
LEKRTIFSFRTRNQARVIGVRGVDGVEQVNGAPFVWLGNKASRFLIVSKIAGPATFSAWECSTGPGGPENEHRQIRVSINGKVQEVDVSGAFSMEVPLKPALNFLDLIRQDPPMAAAQSSGDPQARPLGLWNYRISSNARDQVR